MNNFLDSAVRVTPKHLEREWSLPDTTTKPSSFSPYATSRKSPSIITTITTVTSEMYDAPLNL